MEKHDIYYTALEKGVEKLDEGITCEKMQEYLLKRHPGLSKKFIELFPIWFFKYFIAPDGVVATTVYIWGTNSWLKHIKDNILNKNAFINGEGYSQYMELIELKEAREASIRAQINAKTAIIISIIALTLSLIFSFVEILFSVFQIIIDFLKYL